MSYRRFPSLSPTGRFWTLLNLDVAVNFGFTARMDNFGCRLPAWIFTGGKLAVSFLSSSDGMRSLLSLFEDWSGNEFSVYLYGGRTHI